MKNSLAQPNGSQPAVTIKKMKLSFSSSMRRTVISCLMITSFALISNVSWGQKDFFQNQSMNTAGNYNPSGLPGNGDDVRLTTSNANPTITANDRSMRSLNVTNTTSYTISNATTVATNSNLTLGPALTFTNSFSSNSDDIFYLFNATTAPNLTIQGPNSSSGSGVLNLILAYSGNFNIGSGSTLTISAAISGGFGITKTGSGSFVSSGANSYTGLTTVSGGTLKLNRAGGTTIPLSNSVTINSGGTLQVSSNQTLNDLTLASGGTLLIDNGVTLTIKGTFNHNGGAITLTGTGKIDYGTNSTLSYGDITAQTTTNAEFPSANGPRDLNINNPGGVTLHAPRSITTLALVNGTLINSVNLTINNSGAIQRFQGSVDAAPVFTGSPAISYGGSADNTTGPELPSSVFTLNILGSGNITLDHDVSATAAFNIFSSGSLILGTYNLSATNGGIFNTGHIVTNGTGALTILNIQTSSRLFPVGASLSSYTPIQIVDGGGDDFSVKVQSTFTNAPADATKAVNAEWIISKTGAQTGNSVTLTPQWKASDEGTNFVRANALVLGHYGVSSWDETSSGAVSGSDPYTTTVTGVGSFSPFGVGNAGAFAALTTSNTDYFRSVTTGNWNAPATWESSPVADFSSGLVSPATLAPDNNANTITISNTHTVTVSSSVTADQVVIEGTAVLTIAPGNTLDLLSSTVTGTGTTNINGILKTANTDGLTGLATAAFSNTLSSVTLGIGSRIEYNGSGAQNISGIAYSELTTSTGGTKTLTGNITLSGDLTIGASTDLDVSANNYSIALSRGLNNSGTFTERSGTVTFNGNNIQNVTTAAPGEQFYNLTVDKTGGTLITNNGANVVGVLTLTNGTITVPVNYIRISNLATGSVVRTNGYIIGSLLRAIGTGSNTYSFPVGTSSGYTPASFAFTNVTVPADFQVRSTNGKSANYPASFSATKYLSRYWTVTTGLTAFTSVNATFDFLAGDLVGGVTTGTLKAFKYNGSFSYPAPANYSFSGTTYTFNNITSFSEFGAGEEIPVVTDYYVNDNDLTGDANGGAVGSDANPGTQALPFLTIQHAISVAAAGNTIHVDAGTYTETGQILINKNLTIIGANKTTTIIKPAQNTGNSGDGRAWFLVNPAIAFNLSKVTLDGTGKLVYWGIRQQGSGTIDDCNFTEIKYNPSTDYQGTAIAINSTLTVNVTNSTFSQIGRNGILADQCLGTYSGNTYTGKGAGNFLDYFILSEYGDNVTISNNTVSDCIGVATSDGSGSSGIAVWDDLGTQAIITGNTLTGNSIGVAIVGINGPTTDPQVNIGAGNLFDGGQYGVAFQGYGGAYAPVVTFTGVSTFKGQTIAALSIADGIAAGTTIDISSAVFKTAGGVTITDNFAKEDLVIHAIDAPNRALFKWVNNNVYVTTNSFVAPETTTASIKRGIAAASAGWIVNVNVGTYTETGQIVIDKNLTIIGADKTTTIIKPAQNTGNSGDARAWFLVNSGIAFNMSKVTLDGTGKLVYWGIRQQGSGIIDDCNFTEMKYEESGPAYQGTAIAINSTATVNVTNSTFSQIGRNGILADQCLGTYSGNTYTGKGAGNWLDYFILSEYGDNVTISNNNISNCTGIATVDGSGSSGIAVWDDLGTQAIITGNTLTNNSIGVGIVGINGPTTDPQVNIGVGNLFDGGEYGVAFQGYGGPFAPVVTFTGVSTFKGQTVAALFIDDGIAAGTTIDISSAVFKTAGGVTITDNFAKEDLVIHAIDAPNRGFFKWVNNNVYVTTNSFVSPATTTASIQRGVDAASNGFTVNVAAGTYNAGNTTITVDKSLTFLGPNGLISPNGGSRVAEAIIEGEAVSPNATFNITLSSTTATFKGFKFQTLGAEMRSDYRGAAIILEKNIFTGARNDGMYFDDPNLTVNDNLFTNYATTASETIQMGVSALPRIGTISITNNTWSAITGNGALNSSNQSGTISGNTFNGVEYYGILVAGDASLTISNNLFNNITNPVVNPSGNELTFGAGIRFYEASPLTVAAISNNTFSNSYLGVSVRAGSDITGASITVHKNSFENNSPYSILNAGTGSLDATCNWWGSIVGATIATKISGAATYIPFLTDGTDIAPGTPGFQTNEVCGACTVSAPTIDHITQTTCESTTGSVVLHNLPATGNWTINPGAHAGAGTSATISDLAPGTYHFTVTTEAGCVSTESDAVVIDPQPLITPTFTQVGPLCAQATFPRIFTRVYDTAPIDNGTAMGAPWNNMTGVFTPALVDEFGNPTTVGISFNTEFWSPYTGGPTTGNNSGVYPDNVLHEFYYFGYSGFFPAPETVDVDVTGLDPLKKYKLTFYAGSDFTFGPITPVSTGSTTYTVGANTVTLAPFDNKYKTVSLGNLTPNGAGTITFTMAKAPGAIIGYFNALVISPDVTELPTSSTNIPPILGKWSPELDVSTPGTVLHTFTPFPGQCATTATMSVTVYPVPTLPVIDPVTQPTCAIPTGTVTVTSPANGAGITYTITGPSPAITAVTNGTGIFTGLVPGTYSLTTANGGGCTSPALSVTINTVPGAPATPTATPTQPTCAVTTGTITVNTPIPAANVTYTVTGTNPVVAAVTNATGIFTGLTPGDYAVTTTNTTTGCTSSPLSVTINAVPGAPATPTVTPTQPTCAVPTGTITVNTPIPAANVTYTVTGTNPVVVAVTNATGIFVSLAPGDYAVTTTNTTTSCTSAPLSVTINAVPGAPATPTATPTQPTCAIPTGTITVNTPLPAANVTYTVTGTSPVVAAVTNATGIFAALAPGDYAVTTTNTTTGCTSAPLSVTINAVPSLPIVNAPTVTQPGCTVTTGTILVIAATGGPTPEFSIDNGSSWQLSSTFSGLAPANYNIKVRLISSPTCITTYSSNPVVINAVPVAPIVNAPTVTQPTCATPTGTIVVNATGGTLEYSIDNGSSWQLSSTFSGLLAASYTIKVRLASSITCVTAYSSNPVVIVAATGCCVPPTITAPTVTQPTCATLTGTIVVNATGSGALEYSIDNGLSWQTSSTFSPLAAGSYNIKVRLQSSPTCIAAYSSNPVVLSVPGCDGKTIPGKIEVENFDFKSGPQYGVPTSDAGGGQHIIGLTNGSWMDYNVTVLYTGVYTVNFRVATLQDNVQFQVKLGNTVLGTANIGQHTSSWDTWKTVALNGVSLTAGVQTIRIQLSSNETCNFNWTDWLLATPSTAPTANAGPNQVITLPTNIATLTGSGTAGNGTVIYGWSQVGGTAATIDNPNSSTTTISGLTTAGVRTFRLTVTQTGDAQSATSDVTVTVNATPLPTANAGSPQTIILPTNTANLSGSGAANNGGSITGYAWTLQSKPVGATDPVIQSPLTAATLVTGFIQQGIYTFRLTVTRNDLQTAFNDVTITVNPSGTPGKFIPGKVEAEAWDTKSGPQYAVPTSDAGGGQQVVGMTNGSWLDYNVTVTQTGTYTVNFRIATLQNTAQFQVIKPGAAVPLLGTINVPNTGGWDTWQTVALNNVSLTAGVQTIRIQLSSNETCNFNWTDWVLNAPPVTMVNKLPAIGLSEQKEITANKLTVSVFPNPAESFFNLKVQSKIQDLVTIKVFDMAGRQVQQLQGVPGQALRFGDHIVNGTYLVEVRQGAERVVTKVIKQ